MKRLFWGFVLVTSLLLFGLLFISVKEGQAQSGPIKITDAIPATAQAGKFFETTFTVTYTAGRIILAGGNQGIERMLVDDNLYIDVARPDGTTVNYTHFLDLNFSPIDVTDYFQVGNNQVRVRIENTSGPGEASALWFVNVASEAVNLPFQITQAIPTIPFQAAGTYFGRYFYVDYVGTGRIVLASNPEGKGLLAVDDVLHVQITRPDGVSNVYTHYKGTFAVVDLTAYVVPGHNLVHLWLESTNTDGGSSPFWLTYLPPVAITLPFEVTPIIPAIPSTGGDFFSRYFYVNYDGNNSLWLAANSDSTGDIQINGTLYLQVTQPNGKRYTYTHFSGTFSPVDVSNYFVAGQNLVFMRLEQPSGAAEASAIYLTNRTSQPPVVSGTPSGWQIKVTDPIPAGDGELLNQTFQINYLEGTVILSAYADGTGQMFVNDYLYITVIRPDGTQIDYTHSGRFPPIDLTKYFKIGVNTVHIRLVDTVNTGNASSYWLVNLPESTIPFPIKINDEIANGDDDLLTRHFYMDYQGNGRIILSSFADSTGNMRVNDFIYITVSHLDGTEATYQASGSFTPQDITPYFNLGTNRVKVRLVDTVNTGNASPFWLTFIPSTPQALPFKITDAITTGDGEFLSKYFYVLYSGTNKITLSAQSDGSGQLYINDYVYIEVWHSDQSISIYQHGIGNFAPQDLTAYFNLGVNYVRVRLVDNANTGGSSAFWLSQNALPPTPTFTPTACPVGSVALPSGCATFTPTPTSTSTATARPTGTSIATNTPPPNSTATNTPIATNTPQLTLATKLYLPAISRQDMCQTGQFTPIDVIITLDRSNSFAENGRLTITINALTAFLNEMELTQGQVALVTFDGDVSLVQPLIRDKGVLLTQLSLVTTGNGTALGTAITVADNEVLGVRHVPTNRPIILLLSDGENLDGPDPIPLARAAKAKGIRMITVSAGEDVMQDVMRSLASSAENYYYSTSLSEIPTMLHLIVQKIQCGG